jgi:hypothetical protein
MLVHVDDCDINSKKLIVCIISMLVLFAEIFYITIIDPELVYVRDTQTRVVLDKEGRGRVVDSDSFVEGAVRFFVHMPVKIPNDPVPKVVSPKADVTSESGKQQQDRYFRLQWVWHRGRGHCHDRQTSG